MKENKEYNPNQAWSLLLQGPPKTGKTYLSLLFPNPCMIDCDNNLSGAYRLLKQNWPSHTFKWETVPSPALKEEDRWMKLIDEVNIALKDKWCQTIVIDSISSVSEFLISFIISQKGKDKAAGMTISDWQPYRRLLAKLVTDLRNSRKLVIVTSHEEYTKDEKTGQIITRTNIPSKLADNFGGFFSDVWRTEVEMIGTHSPIYVVRSSPTSSIPAIGNSLGLPNKPWKFQWDGEQGIKKYFERAGTLTPELPLSMANS